MKGAWAFPLLLWMAACGRSELLVDLPVAPDAGDAADDASGGLDGPSPDGPFVGNDGPSFTDAPVLSGDSGPDALPDVAGACGSCFGCCQGNTCILLQDETPAGCGFGGVVCEPCPSSYSCLKGACIGPQPNCGPSNCSGCCADANHCATGTAGDECGFGGHLCQGCKNAPMTCVPQQGGGGSCQPTCGPANCGGCCQGSACLLGKSATACGTMGEACAACASGELCDSQGVNSGGMCQPPCAPSNCAGCCAGQVCAVGTQNIACGAGGGACANCTTTNETCEASGLCR